MEVWNHQIITPEQGRRSWLGPGSTALGSDAQAELGDKVMRKQGTVMLNDSIVAGRCRGLDVRACGVKGSDGDEESADVLCDDQVFRELVRQSEVYQEKQECFCCRPLG